MTGDVEKVLLSEREIFSRLDELALRISEEYRGKELTVIGILNGSMIFLADLLRRIPLPLQVGSLGVSSYQGVHSTGSVEFGEAWFGSVQGRHVLLLDDILDSGLTLQAVRARVAAGAASVRSCVLLRKDVARLCPVDADYVAFDISDEFVVGYGLDYNGIYRNLPFIGVLTNEAIRRYSR